jgi:two-component system LytT family response regulator
VRHERIETIILQTQEGQHYIRLENVIRLEADKNYTVFHCVGRKDIIVSETIKRYEELLPTDQFFRTHQSHIVHRKYVKSFIKSTGGTIEMTDGFQVPVARRKKDGFFEWMRNRSK